MNKPLYVVEGQNDITKLKSLGCTYVVETTGTLLPPRFIKFLKQAELLRPVVLVLDPDGPGREIRKRLHHELKAPFDVTVEKKEAIKHKKVGIHETRAQVLREALKPFLDLESMNDEVPSFTIEDLTDLGLTGKDTYQKKYQLCAKLNLTFKTNKTLVNDFCILCLHKEDIKELLK